MSAPATAPAFGLQHLGAGFAEPAVQSQAVFRGALQAFSRPGTIQTLEAKDSLRGMQVPQGADPAAAALLLALLDQDCKLWLSPQLAQGGALAWLRFHTGCVAADHAAQADFVWLASAQELPALDQLGRGSAEYPEQGATCVVQVQGLQSQAGWRLRGPGIKGSTGLQVSGMASAFVAQWQAQQAHFPCGVDFLFTHGSAFAGLPRSTQIEA